MLPDLILLNSNNALRYIFTKHVPQLFAKVKKKKYHLRFTPAIALSIFCLVSSLIGYKT
jgi:hypothetical protein